jgi:outer membrane lipoprotein-sorting protein
VEQKKITFVLVLVLGMLLLSACAQKDAPAVAVENYIRALVNKDSSQLVNTTCKAWEDSARMELDGFTGVNIQAQDLKCATAGEDGSDSLVNCTGKIVASYNGENQEFPVGRQTYRATLEDNEWRMCGYK